MDSDIIERLKDTVDIFDLFDAATPPVKYQTRHHKHNISCPFHGYDKKPSFTVYPDTNSAFCYTCNGGTAWDVISFWAQINEWWNDDGSLDMGRSISDLCRRYNIRSVRPDWRRGIEENLAGAKAKRQGFAGYPMEEREGLRTTYTYQIARNVMKFTSEERDTRWEDVRTVWDSLEDIGLGADDWMTQLREWRSKARELTQPLESVRLGGEPTAEETDEGDERP